MSCKPRWGEGYKQEGKEEGRKASPHWDYAKSLVDVGTPLPLQCCRSSVPKTMTIISKIPKEITKSATLCQGVVELPPCSAIVWSVMWVDVFRH